MSTQPTRGSATGQCVDPDKSPFVSLTCPFASMSAHRPGLRLSLSITPTTPAKNSVRLLCSLHGMAAGSRSRHDRAIAQRTSRPSRDGDQLALPLFDTPTVAPSATAAGDRAPARRAAADDLRTQHDRALVARIAAAERWARTTDRAAATAPARQGLAAKFEREADPDGLLAPDERARRADLLMRAHMLRMARRSAQARSRSAQPRSGADSTS